MSLCDQGRRLADLMQVQLDYGRPAYQRTKRRLLDHAARCPQCKAVRDAAVNAARRRIRRGFAHQHRHEARV